MRARSSMSIEVRVGGVEARFGRPLAAGRQGMARGIHLFP